MDVHTAAGGDRQHGRGENLAVGDNHQDVGLKGAEVLHRGGIAHLFRLKEGQVFFQGEPFNGGGSESLSPPLRTVGLREDPENLVRGERQAVQRGTSKFGGPQKKNFQSF